MDVAEAGIGRLAHVAQHQVFLDRHALHQARARPVGRNVGDTDAQALGHVAVGDVVVVKNDPSAHRALHAGEHVRQFALAVAVDAGQREDFAGAELEAGVLEARDATCVARSEPFDLEPDLAGLRRSGR